MGEDGGLLRRWDLLLPAVLAPVAETSIALALGPRAGASLGPQVTAPPPFDLFHDLRWISVYHNSWVSLALELVALVVLRSAYVSWIVQRSWPAGAAGKPSMLAAMRRTMAFYTVGVVLLSPWVTVMFGLAVTHVSYLFFVALPPAVAIALAIHRGALTQAAGHWWRWRPSWRSFAWTAGAFAWLTVAGALVSSTPMAVAVPVAAVAGALNACAYRGIVRDIVLGRRPVATSRRWSIPVALAATFAVVVGGAQVGFTASTPGATNAPRQTGGIPVAGQGWPVLVASGFATSLDSRPALRLPDGFVAWRYSYRGLGDGRRPLPYGPLDTMQPLLRSAELMGIQVDALHRAYGRPVTIVAESEGALVSRAYLVRIYQPQSGAVNRVVMLDMPRGASSVYYPPQGAQGWGVGSGWALRGLAAVIRGLGPRIPASADAPFVRDLVDCRSLIAQVAQDPPPPGVSEVSIEALADSVDDPLADGRPGEASYVVAAAHGGLVHRADVQRDIFDLLLESPRAGSRLPRTLARLVAAASNPWQTPGLAGRLAPSSSC